MLVHLFSNFQNIEVFSGVLYFDTSLAPEFEFPGRSQGMTWKKVSKKALVMEKSVKKNNPERTAMV